MNYIKEGGNCHYPGFTSCGCEPSMYMYMYLYQQSSPAQIPLICVSCSVKFDIIQIIHGNLL